MKIKTNKKKVAVILVSLLLLIAVASTIVILNQKNHNNSSVETDEYGYSESSTVEELAFEIAKGEDAVVQVDKINTKIALNNADYNSFQSYINSLSNSYKYEELYGINEALKYYKANLHIEKHAYDVTDGTGVVDSTKLYKIVLKNNAEFFSRTDNLINNFYEKVSDSYIKQVCDLVAEGINKELNKDPAIDKKVVFCRLHDLKILEHKLSTSNAFYSEDGVLSVDEENIKKYQDRNPDIDAFKQTIYHEDMHIIQTACPDQLDKGEVELGICHKYDKLDVNPLFWTWLLDASAEKEAASVLNTRTSTYSAPIGYFDSIILTSILNENVSVSDVNSLCYEKNEGALYKIFNATSSSEKEEIIKMMYSVEIMQASPTDFFTAFKTKTGIDLSTNPEELEKLRLFLRVEALHTLSKEFYKSLSNQLLNGNITLETTYYLINVYESDVFIHLFYNEKARIMSAVGFFDYYTELQNKFFEAVSKSNNLDFKDVVSGFDTYSMNASYNGNVVKNYDLSSIGTDDGEFFESKRKQNYQTGIKNIRDMPAFCKENGYSK